MKSDRSARLPGLEGIRGIAALYVVLHHCYLLCFPGFPANTGPLWTGWLLYGHFAVVIFIVLSGFSLAISPARNDWQLGSGLGFAQRRAWRVLPAYWAAVAISLIISSLVPQPGAGVPTARSVWVYGLLLQDIVGAPSPNGALWSIAVEAQLYALFPFLLVMLRRTGAALTIATILAPVALIGWFAPSVPLVHMLLRLMPQFAVLFAIGVAAAGLIDKEDWLPYLPWLALIMAVAPGVMIVYAGSEWTMQNLFWVDMALGPASGLLLASVAKGRPRSVVATLESRPIRGLGVFSYSLYLIHAPIVVLVHQLIVAPVAGSGPRAFTMMFLVAVPICVVAAKAFAAVFEIPFQRKRGWPPFFTIRTRPPIPSAGVSRIDAEIGVNAVMASNAPPPQEFIRN
jgi:peptidoglycan/LPS O-acetylase OafA/YrhL